MHARRRVGDAREGAIARLPPARVAAPGPRPARGVDERGPDLCDVGPAGTSRTGRARTIGRAAGPQGVRAGARRTAAVGRLADRSELAEAGPGRAPPQTGGGPGRRAR